MEAKMEKPDSTFVARGTHPMMTMLVFAAIIAVVVMSGTYFSKQRSESRDAEKGLGSQLSSLLQPAAEQ